MFENAFTREGDNHDGARNATRMSHDKNTNKAGGSTARAQNVDWVSG